MTITYRYVPGSVVDRVLKALDAAAVPMSATQLMEAIEYTGTREALVNALNRPINLGVININKRFYTRDETPTVVLERRTAPAGPRVLNQWRKGIQRPTAIEGSLRTLMDDGAAVSTGDPLRALADAMDAARAVLAARHTSPRFKGAEVELLVARELRSITIAAQLAVTTLNEALKVLE